MRQGYENFDYWPLLYAQLNNAPEEDKAIRFDGLASAKCRSAITDYASITIEPVTGRTFYYRLAVYTPSSYPGSNAGVIRLQDATGTVLESSLRLDKKISVFNPIAGAGVGSSSTLEYALNTWYIIEIKLNVLAAGNSEPAWRVLNADGSIFQAEQKASQNCRNLGVKFMLGGNMSPIAFTGLHVDAMGINDDQSSKDNSWLGATVASPQPQPTPTYCYEGAHIIGSTGILEGIGEKSPAPYDAETWNRFEAHQGRPVGVIGFSDSSPWVWDGFGAGVSVKAVSRGAFPLKTMGTAAGTLTEVNEGKKDAAIRAWAEAARAFRFPIFLRLWWEFNGTWWEWGVGRPFTAYVEAWRRVVSIIRPIAPSVAFLWCPNVVQAGGTIWDPEPWYPGDKYVDWIGYDGYVGTQPKKNVGWMTPFKLLKYTYDRCREIAPSKPHIIVEIAASETGGTKSTWITELLSQMKTNFPQIKALTWFNDYIEHEGERITWPIESSEAATKAYAAGIADSYFIGPIALYVNPLAPVPEPYLAKAPTPGLSPHGKVRPKLRVPMRMAGGGFDTVEQDSAEEIEACVEAILRTLIGSRIEAPDFGTPDETFHQLGPEPTAEVYLNAIAEWEPRARVLGTSRIEELTERITIESESE